jgi:hypothetical protein
VYNSQVAKTHDITVVLVYASATKETVNEVRKQRAHRTPRHHKSPQQLPKMLPTMSISPQSPLKHDKCNKTSPAGVTPSELCNCSSCRVCLGDQEYSSRLKPVSAFVRETSSQSAALTWINTPTTEDGNRQGIITLQAALSLQWLKPGWHFLTNVQP